ncbi:MgtC/SapB family protein [Psychromarinibacter sp. S121]|uniref:MgtC/SapB family protein n=1 Tax=Psychromarinibacter sp. S121 TaxID=3415127 RepID=UPI003C7C6CCA
MWDELQREFSGNFDAVPWGITTIRLIGALVLGGLIGLEREWHSKPAGLRTHILISLAAALFILVSQQIAALPFGPPDSGNDALRVDPLRLVQAVTAGVAFLAAGVMFTAGGKVHHVTTGASMWLCGAIGLACGAGQIPLAALATAITLAVLLLLRLVERLIGTR